jgi:hypothetical protein
MRIGFDGLEHMAHNLFVAQRDQTKSINEEEDQL